MPDQAGLGTEPGTGLYLHIPFCAHRCHYCDFNTYADLDHLMGRYVEALRADLRRVARAGPGALAPPGADVQRNWPVLTSVFIGGGTPTLLPAHDLAAVLGDIGALFPLAPDAEVTVEANPETVTVEGMQVLAEAGVNRVSMGAQSFRPHVLSFLGRRHDPERPLAAVEAVRGAGIARLNLDLIYGAPAETAGDWDASLRAVLDAGTGHVSAYALTLEPNTEYAADVRAGRKAAPDDEVAADRMGRTDEVLAGAGFARYEISNWARPGQECRHNLTYWRNGNWLAFGAGAHGHWQGRRWWSVRAPARYIERAAGGADTTAGEEILDESALRVERLFLGLRLRDGIARREAEPLDDATVLRLVAAGLLEDRDDRLRLSTRGRALANAVTVELLS